MLRQKGLSPKFLFLHLNNFFIMLTRHFSSQIRGCFSRVIPPLVSVKQNAAITPSQIAELTNNGMAVSTLNSLVFEEGSSHPVHFPLEQSRGIDVAEVWQASKSANSKLKKFTSSQLKSVE